MNSIEKFYEMEDSEKDPPKTWKEIYFEYSTLHKGVPGRIYHSFWEYLEKNYNVPTKKPKS